MTGSQHDPLRSLAEQYCDGTLSAEQTAALEQRLCDDPQAMDFFVLYMEIHSQIAWDARAKSEERAEENDECGMRENDECGMMNDELPEGTSEEWRVEREEGWALQCPVEQALLPFIIHHSAFSICPSLILPLPSPLPPLSSTACCSRTWLRRC